MVSDMKTLNCWLISCLEVLIAILFLVFWGIEYGFSIYPNVPKGQMGYLAAFSCLVAVIPAIVANSKALAKDIELQVYSSVPMRDGKLANNAFLQELPDPVSKVTWDNYIALAPKQAEKLGYKEFDILTVKGENGYAVDLPLLIQPLAR